MNFLGLPAFGDMSLDGKRDYSTTAADGPFGLLEVNTGKHVLQNILPPP